MNNISYKTNLIGYYQEIFIGVYSLQCTMPIPQDSSFIMEDLKKSLFNLGKLIWHLENAHDISLANEQLSEAKKLVTDIHYQFNCLMWLKIIKTQDFDDFVELLRMFKTILESRSF